MKRILSLALLCGTLSLAACGFSPVYTSSGFNSGESSIFVEEIPGRSGHTLRRELVLLLNRGLPGVTEGVLEVEYDDRIRRLAFRPEEASSRSDVIAEADYTFYYGGEEIKGDTQTMVSFNVPTDAFADIGAQADAQTRAARIIAGQIIDELTVQISRETSENTPESSEEE